MKKAKNEQQNKYFVQIADRYIDDNVKNIDFLEKLKKVSSNYIFGDVLDIGSGGIIVFNMHKAKSITISDLVADLIVSPKYVDNGKLKKIDKSRVKVVQASVLNLPFKDNSFDVIVMFDVVHHLSVDTLESSKKNVEVAFSEVNRVLKKNGRFLLLENSPQTWYKLLQEIGYELGYWILSKFGKPLPYFLTEKQLKYYLHKQKLQVKEVINIPWADRAYLPLFPWLYPPGWIWGLVLLNRFIVSTK